MTSIEPGSLRTDWAGRSMLRAKSRIDAYAPTAGARERLLEQISGRQPGDPARAARVVHQVVHDPNPPRRLALGSDALASMEAKSRSILQGLEQHRDLSRSTDFD